ncbi:hypothetical protein SDC9_205852 [bioreactor metagenome]|uniref:Uncharacterized protein n=1 Tax=bioreactor metagenome TaxID=1076179 RepID=A0A645J3E5_9ZZZZ
MGVHGVDALRFKPGGTAVIEQVIGALRQMSALDQNCGADAAIDFFCRFEHIGAVFYIHACEHLRLWEVWGDDGGERKKVFCKSCRCAVRNQLAAGGGDHDGVDNDVFRTEFF